MDLPSRPLLSRRGLLALGAMTLTAAACGTEGSPSSAPSATAALPLPTHKPQPAAKGAGLVESAVPDMPQIYTGSPAEYWTSVPKPPGRGGPVTTFQMLWFAPPAATGANPVWKKLNADLNVQYTPTLVSPDSYNDKLATVLAGGKIPDLLFVQDQVAVAAQAIEAGAFADLTEALAGDKVLKYPNLANLPAYGWKNSSKNGRIFGIPHVDPAIANGPTIRTDLMRAAGYSAQPGSAEELLAMLSDIAKLKRHHGKDVWAIGGLGTYQIQETVRWMHGLGADWRLADGGKLVSFLETDEFAEVAGYLAKLWQAGAFHPDALALGSDKQRPKVKQLWVEGHFAFEFDAHPWLASQGMTQVEEHTDGAAVDFLIPPPAAGRTLKARHTPGYWGIVAISAEAAKDPARLEELLGVCDYFAAPYGTKEELFLGRGIEGYNYRLDGHEVVDLEDDQATTNLQGLRWLGPRAPQYISLDRKNSHRKDGLVEQLELLTKTAETDPTVGLVSKVQSRSGARLGQLNEDWRNKIVSGRSPLTAIKDWREEWKKAGGEELRQDLQKQLG
ncbi:extracellular solute-binding protein [Nonomuraea sp. PA05]|uniref:extracellular solute-binding protein n=1 Tax=Nonomuraea sp. PA05 TaxID=2604466 RepID=UPI0011DB5A11|nr:extracellular solute-binding protein [Nonomuraea sp. PA05]TYB56978.1 extracellular solute-binding protein [Nonomuraea sp. PA05]